LRGLSLNNGSINQSGGAIYVNSGATLSITNFASFAAGEQILQLQIFTPTAATASISSRVSASNGAGIRNARITLTGSSGNSRTILTGVFGFYKFEDLQVGEIYVLQAASKRFTFQNPSRIITLSEDFTDANFVAESF
jgi:hypothetical protein